MSAATDAEALAVYAQRIMNLERVLRLLPEDIDMIEHNPEEGASYFCCGQPVTFGFHGRTGSHLPDCWYVAARAAIAKAQP